MDKDKNPFNLQALDSTVNISILKSQYKKLVVILLGFVVDAFLGADVPVPSICLDWRVGNNVEGRLE